MQKTSLIPSTWQVPDIFRERLGELAGRQRAMLEDGELLLVLHAPPGPDDEKREGRLFWRKPDGTWASTIAGPGQAALDAHLEEYDQILDALDEREEKAKSADEYFELMRRLNPIVRATRNLHAAMQQAREAIRGDKRIINFRDRAYTLERRAELLASDAKTTLEYAVARRAEVQAAVGDRMAVAAHRLNMLVAFFFPLATLAAIFGVNLRHGLEPDKYDTFWPFAAVIAIGLLVGLVLAAFLTRRR